MNEMEDIFKSIKAYLYDRAASPLIGAYMTAWTIWNYRLFVIIFSGEKNTPDLKFKAINSLFESFDITLWEFVVPINGSFFNGLFIPAIITFAYLYLYPLLAKPVYEHSLNKQQDLRIIRQKEENNRLLSVEESREIYRRLSSMQAEQGKEIAHYTQQISSLSQTINDLESQLSSEVKQADSLVEKKLDDINDAAPEEFDSAIRAKIDSLEDNEFQLSDLFTTEQWTALNSSLKQIIGKRLRSKIARGDFVGVSGSRKGSKNQQIYTKVTSSPKKHINVDLSSYFEKILQLFSGLEPGWGQTAPGIKDKSGIHIEAARMHLHDLSESGYISESGISDNNEQLYELAQKGRKYLVEHDLLPSETKA